MYVSLLFWLGLALPGYVLVRLLAKDELKSGLLGTLGLSYLAVLGLLSPVSILCYLVEAPLWVFSSTCALAFAAAVFELSRRRWWFGLGKLVVAAASIELLIVAADMVLGARAGAMLDGDARVHLARIRCLIDQGFSNGDPYIAAKHFFPTYHTNILHALYASCGQITGVDYLGVWFVSLAWGKLLVASGMYYLVWCIFGRRWAAWVAALCVVGNQGPIPFIIYPNQLAPCWVIPCMVGFTIQALRDRCARSSILKLGIGSLLLGQIHGLYVLFAVLLLAPVLAAVSLFKMVRARPHRWCLAACALTLAAGLPFPIVSKLTTAPRAAKQASAQRQTRWGKNYLHFDNGWVMTDPRRGFGAGGWRFALLGLGCAASLASARRREAACFVAILATGALVLYTPPICTALLRALGKGWILGRCTFIFRMGLIAMLLPTAAFWLEPRLRAWWGRSLLSVGVLALAIVYTGHKPPYTWDNYRQQALAPPEVRQGILIKYRGMRGFLTDHLPAGETVLVRQGPSLGLVMLCDSHVVAAGNSNNGVTDLARRQKDFNMMMDGATPWYARRDLLRKYEIQYFLPNPDLPEWVQRHRRRHWRQPGGLVLVLLNTD